MDVTITVNITFQERVNIPDDITSDVVKSREYALMVAPERIRDKLCAGDLTHDILNNAKFSIAEHLVRK